MTEIECKPPGPGKTCFWCPRVRAWMFPHWCLLCQTKPSYRKAWEEGCGPGQHSWTPDQPSRGLGDTVAKLTHAIGIRPCGGCKKRQRFLNKIVPYR